MNTTAIRTAIVYPEATLIIFRRAPIRLPSLLLLALVPTAFAQAPAKVPDTLVFVNDQQLTGELEKADGGGITFKSDMAGEITVPWAKIKSLTSSKSFAILTAKQKLTRKDALSLTPQGVITADAKTITVTPAPNSPGGIEAPKTVPVADASLLVDSGDFNKAINHPPNLLHGWGGTATAGVTVVHATQDNTTFNGAITLSRSTPTVSWLPPRDRTLVNYTQSYGMVSQPGTQSIETNIFHANAERDEYFTPRMFAYGTGTFDHNFASNLGLEEAYGGGIGITVIKNAKQELDFKGDIHYEKENFFNNFNSTTATTQNQNILGSTFTETWVRHISKKGLVFNQFGSVSPAWKQTITSAAQPNAFSAHTNASLVFPVYKGFAFNVGFVDDFINNAPVGSKQNSTQYTSGITYTIKPR